MIVAKKNYETYEKEWLQLEKEPKKLQKPKANHQIKAVHKVQIMVSVLTIAALCVGILFGYAQLTETRYRTYALEKEVKDLESEIENLKVQVEKIKTSDQIEKKAQEQLGMKYPTNDQMVFLNMNADGVTAKENAENVDVDEKTVDKNLVVAVRGAMDKIYHLLD